MLGFGPIAGGPLNSFNEGATLIYVSKDLDLAYAVHAFVSRDLDISYSVTSAVLTVSKDLELAYSVSAFLSKELELSYPVVAFVSASLGINYSVEAVSTYARAPAGDGYRPRSKVRQSRPRDIQGNYR